MCLGAFSYCDLARWAAQAYQDVGVWAGHFWTPQGRQGWVQQGRGGQPSLWTNLCLRGPAPGVGAIIPLLLSLLGSAGNLPPWGFRQR